MDWLSPSICLVVTDGVLSLLFYFVPSLLLAEPDFPICINLLWHFTQSHGPWT